MNRFAASVASCARCISASGIDWPKEMVAVLIMPPQAGAEREALVDGKDLPHPIELVASAAIEAGGVGGIAVQLDHLGVGHAGCLVQAIDVLC